MRAMQVPISRFANKKRVVSKWHDFFCLTHWQVCVNIKCVIFVSQIFSRMAYLRAY
mgnify:CR=1 FL=1|jgi:hypothetical protein